MSSGPEAMGNQGIRHFVSSQSVTAGNPRTPELKTERDKKMWQTSLKFEAVFMQQMLSSMHKSVPKSGFLPSGFAEGVHNSMMDKAVADAASRSDSMGLAPNIYRQLQHAAQAQVQPAPDDTLKSSLKGQGQGERHGAD